MAAAEESFKKKKSAGSGLHSTTAATAKTGGMENIAERKGAANLHEAGKGPGDTKGEGKAGKMQAVSAAGGGHSSAGEENMHAHSHMGGEHDVSHMSIHEVVGEHGPATHTFSEHDHEAGSHHTHTVHGEKHHHMDHDSAEAAHTHLAHSLGGGEEEDTEGAKAASDKAEETPDEEEEETTSTGIPGLT